MQDKIVQYLLTLLNQLKMFHWQTNSFAAHKALGNAYDDLNDLIDDFVEILIGKYGRDVLNSCIINIRREEEIDLETSLNDIIRFLIEVGNSLNKELDTDLINLKDEMLAVVNKTKYLLTLQ